MKLLPYAIAVTFALATALRAADPAPAKTYRIMPVGDSITEGGKSFSNYRLPLLEKLNAAGYHIQYVGSRRSDSPLASAAPKSFRDHPADIVLIHAGHNHFAEEKPVEKIIAAHESMIRAFREINPRVIICLAQVIPSGKLPKYAYLPALNESLAKLATRLNTTESPIILVNQSENFDPDNDTIQDKVHPNKSGAEKMASKWFDALAKVLEKQK
jgi:lysophospholipase L1-like esterase